MHRIDSGKVQKQELGGKKKQINRKKINTNG